MVCMSFPLTPTAADAAERQAVMDAATMQAEIREAVALYPTPNMRRALALCENGTLPWERVYPLVCDAVAAGNAVGAAAA